MRRQRRAHHYSDDDDYRPANALYKPQLNDEEEFVQMERLTQDGGIRKQSQYRFENTMEAKVEDGDTLQALALRFHCTVADIKRLNKIDKENEIHAHKVIKIPVTVHSVLLCSMPQVHKSGNSSPKNPIKEGGGVEYGDDEVVSHIMRNPLEDARVMLDEKLMIASVNSGNSGSGNVSIGGSGSGNTGDTGNINKIIMNSKVTGNTAVYTDDDRQTRLSPGGGDIGDATAPLLDDEYMTQLRPIRGPSLRTFEWSGSDCDMSWVCLFVFILALCFIIPLVYVFYLMEHMHHHNATSH